MTTFIRGRTGTVGATRQWCLWLIHSRAAILQTCRHVWITIPAIFWHYVYQVHQNFLILIAISLPPSAQSAAYLHKYHDTPYTTYHTNIIPLRTIRALCNISMLERSYARRYRICCCNISKPRYGF